MRIHILTFPQYWFFPLMKLKFYSINMQLVINFSIPYISIIHKWSFNISNKTIYVELIESLYSNRSWISFERSVTLIPGTNLIMMIRIAFDMYYRFCDVHLILIQKSWITDVWIRRFQCTTTLPFGYNGVIVLEF
jgi:hypothetical protein